MKKIIRIIALILFSFIFSNIDYTSNWECNSGNISQYHYTNTQINTTRELEKAVIRAKIWKIHRIDGIFEMTDNAIEDGIQNLINTFKETGILINVSEIENIFSDSLYYFSDYNRPFEIMQSYSVDSFINFYYLPNINYTNGSITGYGQAFNTPGNELFVAGNECKYVGTNLVCYDLANTFIPIHELGHCLGLLHTHSTANGDEHVIRDNDSYNLCEINCNDAGDLLCDTAASRSIRNDVSFDGYDCSYHSDETDACDFFYQPQIDNFMSYTHFECANSFTSEQIDKMFNTIGNNNIISETVIDLGDINDDSEINVNDALIIINIILSNEDISDLYLWLGDINNDYTIDIIDILLLINIILDI